MQKLASKLVEVMKACKYVSKNGLNTFHKYKYATSADVLEKVNAALTKQGIATIVLPEIVKDEVLLRRLKKQKLSNKRRFHKKQFFVQK